MFKRKKLPVMLYVHGGWYAIGSADDTFQGPDFMIEHKVIVVTANYRLGIFGFMSLGTPEYSGNMGLKDQQLYMKWVYENIEAFGGDKNRITMMGLSAGGSALGFHMLNKESSKYFNQMICLGGTPNRYHTYQTGDHRCLMEYLFRRWSGGGGNPSNEELERWVKTADVNIIRNYLQETFSKKYSPWNAMIEKPNAIRPIITEDPMTAIGKLKSLNKPAYYTTTKYEYLSPFIIGRTNYSEPRAVREFVNKFDIDLPIFGLKSILDQRPEYLNDVLIKMHRFYFNVTASTTDQELLRQRIVLDSDLYFVYDNDKWIEKHAAISKKDIYYHRFSAQTMINPHPEYPGTGHADEVVFFLRSQELKDFPTKVKDNMHIDAASKLAFDQMNVMQKLFSNFIKYGKPVHNNDVMKQKFKPIRRLSKSIEFNFVDVTNDGLIPGKGPSDDRIKFLDGIIEEVKRLVSEHGDIPAETPIQQRCDAMESGQKIYTTTTLTFAG
ncbi:juvenile hormone esterase-like isoform X2 [Contarinia nasturtii]|nr:juvenile hormone esterase-like isoform X2 [Contarinia nasturtii]